MAKAEYAVVDGKTRKIKKKYAVIDGKTKKIKKEYVVVGGKTKLIWGGVSSLFLGAPYVLKSVYSSEDGYAWKLNNIGISDIISVTYGDGFYYGITESNLYRSEDGTVWTQISTLSRGSVKLRLVRFLNGKLFVLGDYHTSSNNLWYSSDGGETWSSGRYKISAVTTNGTYPLDFQYGTVNGKKGYYLLITNGGAQYNNYTYLYYWASEAYFAYQSAPLNIEGSPFTFIASKGAISISGGNMRIILATPSGSTYFYKYTSTFSQVSNITGKVGWVCSTPAYMICGINYYTYKFNGATVTIAGNLGVDALNIGTFGAAFGNGRVASFGTYDGNACAVIYSDTYGETWTRAVLDTEIPAGYGFGFDRGSMCYGIDGGGYYSE